jgi:hypothetical protein
MFLGLFSKIPNSKIQITNKFQSSITKIRIMKIFTQSIVQPLRGCFLERFQIATNIEYLRCSSFKDLTHASHKMFCKTSLYTNWIFLVGYWIFNLIIWARRAPCPYICLLIIGEMKRSTTPILLILTNGNCISSSLCSLHFDISRGRQSEKRALSTEYREPSNE